VEQEAISEGKEEHSACARVPNASSRVLHPDYDFLLLTVTQVSLRHEVVTGNAVLQHCSHHCPIKSWWLLKEVM